MVVVGVGCCGGLLGVNGSLLDFFGGNIGLLLDFF